MRKGSIFSLTNGSILIFFSGVLIARSFAARLRGIADRLRRLAYRLRGASGGDEFSAALFERRRHPVYLRAERGAEHEQKSAREADGAVGEDIERVIGGGISPGVVKAVIARIFAEIDRARDDVEEVTQQHAEHKSARKSRDRLGGGRDARAVDERTEDAAAGAHHGEGDYVIEEELHGVQDIRSLQELQKPEDKARERTAANAEHIRIKGDGQQRKEGYRAAVRRVEHLDIGKSRGERDRERGIDERQGMRTRRELFPVDEQKRDEYPEDDDDGNRDPDGVGSVEDER